MSFVPLAIERVVLKVQRAWRRTLAHRKRAQRLAAIRIQAWWRGCAARMRLAEEAAARDKGRTVGSLWWVSAHQFKTPKDAEKAAKPKPAIDTAGGLASAAASLIKAKDGGGASASSRRLLSGNSTSSRFLGAGGSSTALAKAGSTLGKSSLLSDKAMNSGKLGSFKFSGSMRLGSQKLSGGPSSGAEDENVDKWLSKAQVAVSRSRQALADREREEQAEAERLARESRLAKRRKRRLLATRRKARGLPRWAIYPMYAVAILCNGVAAYFIILYGLTFEPAISRAWLLSVAFSMFMDLFVQDVVKIFVLTVITDSVQKARAKLKAQREEREAREQAERSAAKKLAMQRFAAHPDLIPS